MERKERARPRVGCEGMVPGKVLKVRVVLYPANGQYDMKSNAAKCGHTRYVL